jgi:pSer/pThr/pTyr-binding forkhead associated (FHA) protein
MIARLVALDDGPDIMLDCAMVVVGRHPACDARLDSLRVSRHHCCMMHENGEVVVRDLGSTNGIRINGQRVEMGRLKAGDELSIAHIRYRLDSGQGHDQTMADPAGAVAQERHEVQASEAVHPQSVTPSDENALAAAVRKVLPSAMAEKCRIQVIVQMPGDEQPHGLTPVHAAEPHAAEKPSE